MYLIEYSSHGVHHIIFWVSDPLQLHNYSYNCRNVLKPNFLFQMCFQKGNTYCMYTRLHTINWNCLQTSKLKQLTNRITHFGVYSLSSDGTWCRPYSSDRRCSAEPCSAPATRNGWTDISPPLASKRRTTIRNNPGVRSEVGVVAPHVRPLSNNLKRS